MQLCKNLLQIICHVASGHDQVTLVFQELSLHQPLSRSSDSDSINSLVVKSVRKQIPLPFEPLLSYPLTPSTKTGRAQYTEVHSDCWLPARKTPWKRLKQCHLVTPASKIHPQAVQIRPQIPERAPCCITSGTPRWQFVPAENWGKWMPTSTGCTEGPQRWPPRSPRPPSLSSILRSQCLGIIHPKGDVYKVHKIFRCKCYIAFNVYTWCTC